MPKHSGATRAYPSIVRRRVRTRPRWMLPAPEQREHGLGTRRRANAGQTLIIFALTLSVLIGVLGLAIDSIRVFDLYARMQRAAEAGALAGVAYMPNAYGAPVASTGDNRSAISRALDEVYKNGFGTPPPHAATVADCPIIPDPTTQTICTACPNPPTATEIAVCPVVARPTDLRVTITEHINALLLGVLGVGTQTISASAEAQYLPLVQLGSRSNYFGDQVECGTPPNTTACTINDPANHLQYFVSSFDGPAELKESGDPFVYCAEGDANAADFLSGTDPTSAPPTYNGYGTNHPQWTGVANGQAGIAQYCGLPGTGHPGNPDYQPAGYAGPATGTPGYQHPGGYNYEIIVPPGVSSGSVWVYNPYYIPNFVPTMPPPPPGTPRPPPLDHFSDNGATNFYQGPAGGGIGNNFDGSHHDAPLFFYNTTFTLYQVNSLYDRSSDAQLATDRFQPYDAVQADLTTHGCDTDGSQVYDPYWNGPQTANTYYNPTAINPSAHQGCVASTQLAPPVGTAGVTCVSQYWCKLPASIGAGVYRMVVEGTGLAASTTAYTSNGLTGWGQHSYAVKVCDSSTLSTPVGSGCGNGSSGTSSGGYVPNSIGIFGWNNMDVNFMAQLSQSAPSSSNPLTSCVTTTATLYTCLDLGCIPSQYAGRTVRVGIFDPGDAGGSGNLYLGVVPPAGVSDSAVTYPSQTTVQQVDGESAVLGSSGPSYNRYRPYNGLWLNATIVLPPSYTGDCSTGGSGWWQLMYAGDAGVSPNDKLTVAFSLVGSPEHLVIPGS